MTWSERELWKALRPLGFNFRRQAPIGRYVVDFASHRASLVIEVDGGVHERLDHVMERDAERQIWLESQGYTVLRFSNAEIEKDLGGCLTRVKALLLDGGGLGGGVATEDETWREWEPAPGSATSSSALRTPPSSALPPRWSK